MGVCSAVLLEQMCFFCFLEKELPKSCNYHFIFVRQKSVGALDVSLGALSFGGGRLFFLSYFLSFLLSFFRHCHPV